MKYGLLVRLKAKTGKELAVEEFITAALPHFNKRTKQARQKAFWKNLNQFDSRANCRRSKKRIISHIKNSERNFFFELNFSGAASLLRHPQDFLHLASLCEFIH